jgi:DHA1 family inner membrane transport protein
MARALAGAGTGRGSTTSRARTLAALAALAASAACFITVESLPIGLLPQIAGSMHRSLSATGLLVTIYALVVVAATVPLTYLTRPLGRRSLLAAVATMLVLGSLASAAAPSYGVLVGSRIFTALGQSVFWALAPVEAAGLVSPTARGHAVTAVFAGSATGIVLGLPAGTWLGRVAGWRFAFVALAAIALLALVAIVIALPHRDPAIGAVDGGRAPNARRYRAIVASIILVVTAFYVSYTYISPFLTRVSGLSRGTVPLVLLAAGLTSSVGLASGGFLYARFPRGSMTVPAGAMAVALLCLFLFAKQTPLAAVFIALDGLGLGLLVVAAQTAVIELSPQAAEIGTAWFSSAFNGGIASGPLIGALVLSTSGLRATALAGAAIAAAAVGLLLFTDRLAARRRPAAAAE